MELSNSREQASGLEEKCSKLVQDLIFMESEKERMMTCIATLREDLEVSWKRPRMKTSNFNDNIKNDNIHVRIPCNRNVFCPPPARQKKEKCNCSSSVDAKHDVLVQEFFKVSTPAGIGNCPIYPISEVREIRRTLPM